MIEHCDFDEQVSTTTDEGRLRPDMVVHMPGGGEVVIDAKVPLEAFLQLLDADDDERAGALPGQARTAAAHPRRSARQEGLLEAVRAFARDGRCLHPGRPVACRRIRSGSDVAGARHVQRRPADHARHADCPAAHRRSGVAAGDVGRERTRDPEAGSRALRPPPGDERPHADAAAQPCLDRRGLQPGRRFVRVPGAGVGPQVPEPRRDMGRRSPTSPRSRRRRATSRRTSRTSTRTTPGRPSSPCPKVVPTPAHRPRSYRPVSQPGTGRAAGLGTTPTYSAGVLHVHRSERADALVSMLARLLGRAARGPHGAGGRLGPHAGHRAVVDAAVVGAPGRQHRIGTTASAPTSSSRFRGLWSRAHWRGRWTPSPTRTRGRPSVRSGP